jgi:hypothetical protein
MPVFLRVKTKKPAQVKPERVSINLFPAQVFTQAYYVIFGSGGRRIIIMLFWPFAHCFGCGDGAAWACNTFLLPTCN